MAFNPVSNDVIGCTTNAGLAFLMEREINPVTHETIFKEPCAINQVRLPDGGMGVSLQPLLMFSSKSELLDFNPNEILFMWEPDERMKSQYLEVCQALSANRAGLVTAKTQPNGVIVQG